MSSNSNLSKLNALYVLPCMVDSTKQINTSELDLDVVFTHDISTIKYIFTYFRNRINKLKSNISNYDKMRDWDKMKKITNEYELIFISNSHYYNNSICKYIPVSRSYFKMKEIMYNFKNYIKYDKPLTTLHIAEGPGGFIEALHNMRKHFQPFISKKDHYFGLTLAPNEEFVPSWDKIKKKIQNNLNNGNIHLSYMDLYNQKTIQKLDNTFNTESHRVIDIATADGGFDYSKDYIEQETASIHIILSEIMTMLRYLKSNGVMIVKLFDIFSLHHMKLLYLTSLCFEKCFLFKPTTSRPANSEKYLICVNHIPKHSKPIMEKLLKIHKEWNDKQGKTNTQINYLEDFTKLKVPKEFIHGLNQYCDNFTKYQANYLKSTFKLIDEPLSRDEYNKRIKEQVKYASLWCKYHNEELNNDSAYMKK